VKTHRRIRPRRFPGICAFADSLGVDRRHVYEVLVGNRKSKRISRAWRTRKKGVAA